MLPRSKLEKVDLYTMNDNYHISKFDLIQRSFANLNLIFKSCLNGFTKPRIYLFKASCGLGKSRSVQSFLSGWKAAGFKGRESVIIALFTTDEIKSYIEQSDLNSADYAVYINDEDLASRGRGKGDAENAPVLFITHEMFKRRVSWPRDDGSRGFKAANEFYFKGGPRSFIIYDETLHRAKEIAISCDTLAALPELIRATDPALTQMLEAVLPFERGLSTDVLVELPVDLGRALAASYPRLELLLSRKAKSAIDMLIAAAGTSLTITRDNRGGYHLVGACNPLPADLPPVVVLDGSIGLRATYDLWDGHNGGVTFLEAAKADYRHLTIRWWDRGCSKSTLGNFDCRHEILCVLADLINGNAGERWLVIHPMDRVGIGGFAISSELRGKLAKPENVSFTHWGRHVATNEFRETTNVIIMGENFYRNESYDAYFMAASGKQHVTIADRRRVRHGEFGHHVYQAICRSNVRQIIDGIAGHATAYLITTFSPEKDAMLRQAFDGCSVDAWQPVEGKPPTKVHRLIAEIEKAFNVEGCKELSVRELALRCGGTVGKYLTRQWQDEGVIKCLAANDLVRGKGTLRRITKRDEAA